MRHVDEINPAPFRDAANLPIADRGLTATHEGRNLLFAAQPLKNVVKHGRMFTNGETPVKGKSSSLIVNRHFHGQGLRSGVPTDTQIKEGICDRWRLAAEVTSPSLSAFAKRVGLTSPQMTNIGTYRNAPSHEAIYKAWQEFGIPADYFYWGSKLGFRDPEVAKRLSELEARDADRKASASV